MKRPILILILSITAFAFVWSCKNNNREELNPTPGTCNTTNVSYATTVVPIIKGNCIACHQGNSPSGGINLDGYINIKQYTLNGKLYGAISHQNGFSPMPKGGTKLPTCTIDQIKSWIDSGAPNN